MGKLSFCLKQHRLAESMKAPTSAEWLLVRTTRACIRTLRDARAVYLAANYVVGIALLEPLQTRLTARG